MSGLAPFVLVGIIGYLVLLPFHPRKIGGAGGGSEKAIVGTLWVVAGIVIALVLASR